MSQRLLKYKAFRIGLVGFPQTWPFPMISYELVMVQRCCEPQAEVWLSTAWPRTTFPGLQILNERKSPAPSPLQPSIRLVSGGLGQVPVLSLALRVTLARTSQDLSFGGRPPVQMNQGSVSRSLSQLGSVVPPGGQMSACF